MPKNKRDRQKAFIKAVLIPLVIITAAAAAVWLWMTPAPKTIGPSDRHQAAGPETKQPFTKEPLPGSPKRSETTEATEKAAVQKPPKEPLLTSIKISEINDAPEKVMIPKAAIKPLLEALKKLETTDTAEKAAVQKPPKRLKITLQEIFSAQEPKPQALSTPEDNTSPPPREEPKRVRIRVKHLPVIDYNKLDQDQQLRALIDQRKEAFGIEKGVDLIVKSDESLKVGDITVPMQEILDEIHLKEGDIIEKSIPKRTRAAIPKQIQPDSSKAFQTEASGDKKATTQKAGPTPIASDIKTKIHEIESYSRSATILGEKVFGIHVVRTGENIWNLHFQILRDYFARRDLPVSFNADEPISNGSSTGIGKLLKFSENLVYIYNLRERRLATDLNLIQPLEKIVIYNMARVFELLDQIDFGNIDHIQFDGEVIWIPTED